MSEIKQLAAFANRKLTAAAVFVSTLIASNAFAGPIAEAVKSETGEAKADLYSTGGVVVGLVIVGVIFGAGLRLLKKAG